MAQQLWEACGNFIASIIMGYFVNITFESPFINLEAVIFKRDRHDTSSGSKIESGVALNSNANTEHNPHSGHLDKRLLSKDQLMKAKNSLQPSALSGCFKSTSSEQNSSDSDSNDNKSTTAQSSDQQAAISSPEQDRKLSSGSNNDNSLDVRDLETTPATRSTHLQNLPKHMRWTGREYQGSLKVKALRPRHNSVEEIFCKQEMGKVEPLVELNYEQKVALNSPTDTVGRHQRAQQSLQKDRKKPLVERVKRYSSYDPPLETTTTADDHLYPITGEYKLPEYSHYARAGFQPQLYPSTQRASQYATLARTSRFNHESNLASAPNQSKDSYVVSGKARSYLDEPISRPMNQYQREASYLMKQRAQLFQRRQGRYNTLTGGAGSIRQWRQQYEGESNPNEEIVSQTSSWRPPLWSELLPSTDSSRGDNWLQPGTMIPRIDSSTLRRHGMRPNETTTAGSIVEETTYEDDEEQESQNVAL